MNEDGMIAFVCFAPWHAELGMPSSAPYDCRKLTAGFGVPSLSDQESGSWVQTSETVGVERQRTERNRGETAAKRHHSEEGFNAAAGESSGNCNSERIDVTLDTAPHCVCAVKRYNTALHCFGFLPRASPPAFILRSISQSKSLHVIFADSAAKQRSSAGNPG